MVYTRNNNNDIETLLVPINYEPFISTRNAKVKTSSTHQYIKYLLSAKILRVIILCLTINCRPVMANSLLSFPPSRKILGFCSNIHLTKNHLSKIVEAVVRQRRRHLASFVSVFSLKDIKTAKLMEKSHSMRICNAFIVVNVYNVLAGWKIVEMKGQRCHWQMAARTRSQFYLEAETIAAVPSHYQVAEK